MGGRRNLRPPDERKARASEASTGGLPREGQGGGHAPRPRASGRRFLCHCTSVTSALVFSRGSRDSVALLATCLRLPWPSTQLQSAISAPAGGGSTDEPPQANRSASNHLI